MRDLWRDIRHALRMMRRNPGYTTVVVLTLALGIGVNTAIFSVVDGIVFRPLPFPDEDHLVSAWADYSRRDGPVREWLSYPNFHDLRNERDVFEDIGVYGGWAPTLSGAGDALQLNGAAVTAGMFGSVLRVPPLLGRTFLPEDDVPGAPPVVVLSHALWARVFAADQAVVGRTMMLGMLPYTVVGVMPADFRPPFITNAEIWQTLQLDLATTVNARGSAFLRGIGRVRKEVTLDEARARAELLGANLEAQYPEDNAGIGFAVFPLRDDVVRTASAGLYVLLGAVTLVLLLACLNVANLTLARTAARRGELAVRAAVGAGGSRIARQILTESVVLAAIGGTLGLAAAYFGTGFLVSIAPAGTPRLSEVGVDGRVLGFALVITTLVGVLFGVLPALRAARQDLHGSLKEGGRTSGHAAGSAGLRNSLVVGQVGLALLLVVGAGLFVRTLRELNTMDPGFDADHRLTLQLNLPPTQYPDRAATRAFYADLEERLGAVPGITRVASVNSLPLTGFDGDADFKLAGQPPPPPGKEHVAWIRRVTPGYFETMGISVRAGRDFTKSDHPDAPLVVVVNETLAEHFFPDRNPVGERIYFGDPSDPVYREIVGVVEDVKNFGMRQGSRNAIYFPFHQVAVGNMFLVLGTSNDPASMIGTVRRVIAEINPNLAAGNVASMDSVVRQSLGPERFMAMLFGLFAVLAFLLAAVGLYGVISYNVNQRMHEMGLRVALGAADRDIGRLVLGKILGLAGAGIGLGIVALLALGGLIEGLLFGVRAHDPVTLAVASAMLVAVACVAGAGPARRAVRVDPVSVLKGD